MKVFFRRIHLYLGLAAGLVITISCLTGALLVFEKELTEAFNHSRYYVKPEKERLSLDQIAEMVKQQVPGAGVARIQVYADPSRSLAVSLDEGKKGGDNNKAEGKKEAAGKDAKAMVGKEGKPGGKEPKKGKGRTAFVNPYTGKVIELYSYQQTFYYRIFSLHRWLLAGDTGKMITGISTLIFLFILITGIILWWPKTRKILQQRLKVKWDGGWKRLNHDMHVVLGFYVSIFLFVSVFTGLTWSFEWFNKGLYTVLGTSPKGLEAPASVAPAEATAGVSYEAALAQVKQQVPDAQYYAVAIPKDKAAAIQVTLLPAGALHEGATSSYYLDRFNGHVLQSQTFSERNLGQKVRGLIKPLHTGAVFGLPSKIFALLLALLGATFPTTGTILWINRTMKKKKAGKNKQRMAMPVAAA
ncbi:PepSY-associated TM helix domain-containing protein [Chitinophaga qingshengii]|uniref:PepSY domain-containing protein n=1 Tax=Chitinophaga qingshengii TaxID=1569794 RepID=A0ABR7TQG3_9BACT|nr:PepSY-associated TM helix domain-containing protein [Chitinophaga qingshengii]MBC9931751.1 PepSY domain-containing protein [Chitinophaga qingshengii]